MESSVVYGTGSGYLRGQFIFLCKPAASNKPHWNVWSYNKKRYNIQIKCLIEYFY